MLANSATITAAGSVSCLSAPCLDFTPFRSQVLRHTPTRCTVTFRSGTHALTTCTQVQWVRSSYQSLYTVRIAVLLLTLSHLAGQAPQIRRQLLCCSCTPADVQKSDASVQAAPGCSLCQPALCRALCTLPQIMQCACAITKQPTCWIRRLTRLRMRIYTICKGFCCSLMQRSPKTKQNTPVLDRVPLEQSRQSGTTHQAS